MKLLGVIRARHEHAAKPRDEQGNVVSRHLRLAQRIAAQNRAR